LFEISAKNFTKYSRNRKEEGKGKILVDPLLRIEEEQSVKI
jgi:hypothetical protein